MTRRAVVRDDDALLLCRVCGEQKPKSAYTPSDWQKYVKRAECRACRQKYSHERYERQAATMKRQRQEKLAVVRAIKSARGCRDCGETHHACLDFHHRDRAQKDRSVGALCCGNYPMETLLAEIAKCDVLCSNCHRKHHWEERHGTHRDPKVIPFPTERTA